MPCVFSPQIWPWLLGLYPVTSTDKETESIRAREGESYRQELEEWRKVEVVHLRLLAVAEIARQERMRREYAAHMSELGIKRIAELPGREGNDGGEGEGGEEEGGEGGGGEERGEVGEGASSHERSATPIVAQDSVPFEGCGSTQTPPTDTPLAHSLRNSPPELITLTEHTSPPLPSSPYTTTPQTHPPQTYIIPPQNDVVSKTRSSSVDSGHSSNCNLGNSIGSSHGNGLVNGCHADEHTGDDSLVEWSGDSSGMDPGLEGGEELAQSTLTIVPDGREGEHREEEEEGEKEREGEGEEGGLELDERGRLFADELLKIDKDIPRCDRDYW